MPKDACYHKVVARYGPKTSAYRSGAMAKCRKVGAANWGNKSKKEEGGLAASVMSDVYGSGRKLMKKGGFRPHMMYDPKTGKGYKANKKADHERMDKKGYTHRKPKKKQRGGESEIGPKSAKRFRENPFPGPAFTREQEERAARARKKVKGALIKAAKKINRFSPVTIGRNAAKKLRRKMSER